MLSRLAFLFFFDFLEPRISHVVTQLSESRQSGLKPLSPEEAYQKNSLADNPL